MSYSEYERLKQEWVKNNPHHTPRQYQKAMAAIARKLRI